MEGALHQMADATCHQATPRHLGEAAEQKGTSCTRSPGWVPMGRSCQPPKKMGGSPHPTWFCRGEGESAALGDSAGGCSQRPPSSTGSIPGSGRVCQHSPKIRDPATGCQHPWEGNAGAELAQERGQLAVARLWWGLNPAPPGFNTLLKPSYLKMMGKQGKESGFSAGAAREGLSMPCAGLCGAAAPGIAGSSSGCPGASGERSDMGLGFSRASAFAQCSL